MSKLKVMNIVSQRHNHFQNWNSLSTLDNAFHFYEFRLNRNRMIQAHSQNGNLITPQICGVRFPKWECFHSPRMGGWLNRHLK